MNAAPNVGPNTPYSPYASHYTHPAPVIDEPDGTGRHPVHLAHLVWGVVFAAFLGIWALVATANVPTDDLRWLLPVPWLLAGVAGLLAAALGRRPRRGAATPASVLDPQAEMTSEPLEGENGMVGGDAVDTGRQERDDL